MAGEFHAALPRQIIATLFYLLKPREFASSLRSIGILPSKHIFRNPATHFPASKNKSRHSLQELVSQELPIALATLHQRVYLFASEQPPIEAMRQATIETELVGLRRAGHSMTTI